MSGRSTTALKRAEQTVEVLELRSRGASLAEIARALDISVPTASRRLRKALQQLGSETADEMRRASEVRLNDVLQRTYGLLDEADRDGLSLTDRIKLFHVVLTIERQRAQLWGVAIPANVVLSLEHGAAASALRAVS